MHISGERNIFTSFTVSMTLKLCFVLITHNKQFLTYRSTLINVGVIILLIKFNTRNIQFKA